MTNKKQDDNRVIREITEYYEDETKRREKGIELGCFRVGDNGVLEICNGFIKGEPRWAVVDYQLLG